LRVVEESAWRSRSGLGAGELGAGVGDGLEQRLEIEIAAEQRAGGSA
jgi:hypothetical protein